ncbi:Membrane protein insertase YidC [uncultured Paludibacter sp.]|nr:Membrane protein insertase YidC [uncultured Paludibacter sp.]
MDKNTVIGFGLIAAIVIGFTLLNKPSQEDIKRQQRYSDSIALVQHQQIQQTKADSAKLAIAKDSLATTDTTKLAQKADAFGAFSASAFGEEKLYEIENEYLKIKISNKGGRIYSVQLKNYKTHDSLPLMLFDKDESSLNYIFSTNNNRVVNSADLYFEPVGEIIKDTQGNQTLTMRLKTTDPNAYMDFIYTIPAKDYMIKYNLKATGMNAVMPIATNSLELQWKSKIRQQEKGRKFEERYSAVHYKYSSDDEESLNASKDIEKTISNKLKWVAFKDQFFSSIFIADEDISSATLSSVVEKDVNNPYLKYYSADMILPFDPSGRMQSGFRFYFGPNQYKILNAYDKGVLSDQKLKLRSIVPLGWGIFGWINRFIIIPMFNVFSLFMSNFGIIILLMTIVIKMVLFPLTYKSYMSSAKMRVLKPEIDEINARIPSDKPMERQKATMDLYNKVGVSPMSGCLPMLLQMPILFAMFSFFPSSFELRQQSFLWAKDLSAYDSILHWSTNLPLIGNHLSLFCILMTVTSIISTKLNMATTPQATDQPGGEMMKWSMYLMPVMFFFMFNDYASGLSYYYFISSLITIAQTYAIRAFVDDKKILAQLHAKRNSKAPAKKSGFMERLEKMQRDQQKALQQKNKKR